MKPLRALLLCSCSMVLLTQQTAGSWTTTTPPQHSSWWGTGTISGSATKEALSIALTIPLWTQREIKPIGSTLSLKWDSTMLQPRLISLEIRQVLRKLPTSDTLKVLHRCSLLFQWIKISGLKGSIFGWHSLQSLSLTIPNQSYSSSWNISLKKSRLLLMCLVSGQSLGIQQMLPQSWFVDSFLNSAWLVRDSWSLKTHHSMIQIDLAYTWPTSQPVLVFKASFITLKLCNRSLSDSMTGERKQTRKSMVKELHQTLTWPRSPMSLQLCSLVLRMT